MLSSKLSIKEIQTKSLEILADFDAFCYAHDIRYSVAFGTALGCVRHNGYIPWDDDIDVHMHISEFRKFAATWTRFGDKKKYFLQSKKTDPNLPNLFPRLRMNNTTSMDCEGLDIPMHWGLPLDIFLYYNVPRNCFIQRIVWLLAATTKKCGNFAFSHYKNGNIIRNRISVVLTLIGYKTIEIVSFLNRKSGIVTYLHWGGIKNDTAPESFFAADDRMPFEGITLSCSRRIREYLEWQYGDYMTPPPEDERLPHPTYIVDLDNDYSKYVKWTLKGK